MFQKKPRTPTSGAPPMVDLVGTYRGDPAEHPGQPRHPHLLVVTPGGSNYAIPAVLDGGRWVLDPTPDPAPLAGLSKVATSRGMMTRLTESTTSPGSLLARGHMCVGDDGVTYPVLDPSSGEHIPVGLYPRVLGQHPDGDGVLLYGWIGGQWRPVTGAVDATVLTHQGGQYEVAP